MLQTILLGFGLGLPWSFIPGYFSEIIKNPFDGFIIMVSGGITGSLVALAIKLFPKKGILPSLLMSPFVLAFAGSAFGVLLTEICSLFPESTPYLRLASTNRSSASYNSYGFLWLIPPICFFVIPLSVASTWLVQKALPPPQI
jgi:hypothetical protein